MPESRLVLVTGATGYIVGRLVPQLLVAGYQVRCLVRDAKGLRGRSWSRQVDVAEADALRPETLPAAMKGVRATSWSASWPLSGAGSSSIPTRLCPTVTQKSRWQALSRRSLGLVRETDKFSKSKPSDTNRTGEK